MTSEGAKAVLRKTMRARRRALAAEIPDAGERVVEHFLSSHLGPFATAATYLPTGAEIDPRPLARALAERGARLALPVVVETGAPLAFRLDTGVLERDALGLPAPPDDAPTVRPDLIVTPLLAYDPFGGRLGQGGGYFDRTLAELRAGGEVFVMGLAYAGQEVERLPEETHDQPLDAVLTEEGLKLSKREDG